MPRKKTKTLNACPLWPEGIRMVEICRVFFWGGRLVKGSVRSVVFWGGKNPWCWKKVFSYGNYSRYCFRQGLLKETRLQLEKKEPLPRYVWWFWTYIKKMHPFFIQPWHRGILGTKVHVINIFSNYHSGSLEESWQRRMIQHQPRDLPRALEDHPLNKALKKKLMFFCSHSWILNTHHCQNPHFLRRVKSESLESWTPHPRKRIGHESIPQIRAAMENPGPTWNFPSWKKARKICPCCFFNTLSPYVKILTVFCSPRGWVPPSSSSIPWSISPTYGTVLQLTYSHHKANGIYMYYYTRSLPILIFKLSPLLEEDLNMRKMYKVILAYSPGAMQHNGLHIWELWDGDEIRNIIWTTEGGEEKHGNPIPSYCCTNIMHLQC